MEKFGSACVVLAILIVASTMPGGSLLNAKTAAAANYGRYQKLPSYADQLQTEYPAISPPEETLKEWGELNTDTLPETAGTSPAVSYMESDKGLESLLPLRIHRIGSESINTPPPLEPASDNQTNPPSEDQTTPPSDNQTNPPPEDQSSTPSDNQITPPPEDQPSLPSDNLTNPSQGQSSPPADNKANAPPQDQTNTATENQTSPPAHNQTSTPPKDETSTPSDNQTSPPSEDETYPVPQDQSGPKSTKNITVVDADKDAEIKSDGDKIKVHIPKGAVSKQVEVEMVEHPLTGSTGTRMLKLFELNDRYSNSLEKVAKFNKDLTISINHQPGELERVDINSLRLCYLDDNSRKWIPLSNSKYDRETMVLTATVNHFSYFGEQADPIFNGPGRITVAGTDPHTGAAVFNYPIELPPGPGGFQPQLTLAYDSRVADEMKNKRASGSWVGIGWALHPGRIYCYTEKEKGKEYFIEFGNDSYRLAKLDATNYSFVPDNFWKITRNAEDGNTWVVLDPDGNYYRFGGTPDSEQYIYDYEKFENDYYRWDLSLLRDTNGNEATVTYVRDMWNSSIRSAYPQYLKYNNDKIIVQFNSSCDENGGSGSLRKDNPIEPAPTVIENRKLDSILIKASNVLLRKYVFAYNTTDRILGPDGYYSGKHTLSFIKQIGADGNSQLPTMSFEYADKQTYRHVSWEPQYTGNPGNPASLSWPHLTVIHSGYGGDITFSYTQIPDTTADSIWTREAVTAQSINSGLEAQKLIGDDDATPAAATGANYLVMDKWAAAATGIVTQIKVKCTIAGNIKVALYGDNAGSPGALLNANNAGAAVVAGWNTINIPATLVTLGTNYWIAYISSANCVGRISYSGGGLRYRALAYSSDFPSSAGTGFYTSANNHPLTAGWACRSYIYTYTGSPQYIGSSWDQEYRGFAQVKITDSANNYNNHWFYATGMVNSKNAEKLTGMEYKTQWCDATGQVLRERVYEWTYAPTGQNLQLLPSNYPWTYGSDNVSFNNLVPNLSGIAVSSDGNVYVVDSGNHRVQKFYSSGGYISQWGSYGSGDGQLKNPSGIAVSSDGNVYVVDAGKQRVQIFSSSGVFMGQFGSYGSDPGQFKTPSGIAVSSEGQVTYVYVADSSNHRIQKFVASGGYLSQWCTYVSQWGSYGSDFGKFKNPSGITVSQEGTWPNTTTYVYVVDSGNHRVQKFDSSGVFMGQFGSYGSGDGQLKNPSGIAVSQEGTWPNTTTYVYVVDSGNHRVQKFYSGFYVSQWGSYGSGDGSYCSDFGKFKNPSGIAAIKEGSFPHTYINIYVADSGNHRIQKFDSSGGYVSQWGSHGSGDGQFNSLIPRHSGIDITNDGYIYITDIGNQRVQKFDASGLYISQWGSYGSGDVQFDNPSGIAVSSDGSIYVVDTDNNRVQKFNSSGVYISQWGSYGSGDGQFNSPSGIAVSSDGSIYVVDTNNNRVQKFNSSSVYVSQWGSYGSGDGQFNSPSGIAVSSDGSVFVVDSGNHRIQKFSLSGSYLGQWGSYGTDNGQFNAPSDITISSYDKVYVVDLYNSRVQAFDLNGTYLSQFGSYGSDQGQLNLPGGIATWDSTVYVMHPQNNSLQGFDHWTIRLNKVEDTVPKASRIRYEYDDYGNVVHTYVEGDLSTNNDDTSIHYLFYPNTDNTTYILRQPARERVYATITNDIGGDNLKKETSYYYDGNNTSLTTPPTKGNLTRLERKKDASSSVNSYFTYDTYGNQLTSQDPNGNIIALTFDTTYHTYPVTMTYPVAGLSESYSYNPGTKNLTSLTAVNGATITYEYDTFKRQTKVIKPGDSSQNPSIEYQYNNWGTLNQQHVKVRTKIADGNYLWQSQYFDGIGRVVQTQAMGETGRTIISGTTTFNNRGLVDRNYVSQDLDSAQVTGYKTPEAGWKYTSYAYDGLSRVTAQNNADGTTISTSYSISDWITTVTNQRGFKKRYTYDFFDRLVKVEELDASHVVYATTIYTHDVVCNLVQVKDNSNNITSMTYDWLCRKTAMTDPDMGSWSYGYDANSNLTSQTDAKNQTITLTYDALNRLAGKAYPQGSGMTNVTYTYDSTAGGNYGKGQRTGMVDALGTASYKYDARGRLIEEKRTADSVDYTTSFAYDAADRLTSLTYPTGETLTNSYNGRGLPYSLSGSVAGNLITSMLYNGLGLTTEINLGNGAKTTLGYWGAGGSYDTTGGYYGRLWEIKTSKQPEGSPVLMDMKYTWDAGGNLTQRENLVTSETETFGYDFLDRLTSASGPYSESYTYDQIGNINSKGGLSYTYGTKPHAVTSVGSTSYAYDNNGNMITRGSQMLTWDVENKLIAVSDNGTAQFVYDGCGNRVKKTEGGETILYINKYYEKNLTTSVVTTNYYLGANLVAQRKGTDLQYVHQDHLGGTSVMSDSDGNQLGTISYFPFGATRSGFVPTDRKFTGQRLDSTGLYYYNARYYDPNIGRLISADTFIQSLLGSNTVCAQLTVNEIPLGLGSIRAPQGIYPNMLQQAPLDPRTLNRYSFVLNNPLQYIDPYGWWIIGFGLSWDIGAVIGYTISITAIIDGHGNLNFAVIEGYSNPTEGTHFYGAETDLSLQFMFDSKADTTAELAGESEMIEVTGTIGPTTAATWGIINAGMSGSTGLVFGQNSTSFLAEFGGGISLIPVAASNMSQTTTLYGSLGEAFSAAIGEMSEAISEGLMSSIIDNISDFFSSLFD